MDTTVRVILTPGYDDVYGIIVVCLNNWNCRVTVNYFCPENVIYVTANIDLILTAVFFFSYAYQIPDYRLVIDIFISTYLYSNFLHIDLIAVIRRIEIK